MEMFLDHRVAADDPNLKRVYENFRANLHDIIEVARRSGSKVLVSTVATNDRDSGPFASVHTPNLPAEKQRASETLCASGLTAANAGNWADALTRYHSAAAIDEGFAEAHFGVARARLRLGNQAAARDAFRRARDLDALRFRADSAINDMIRAAASSSPHADVEFVDGEAAVAQSDSAGVAGSDAFYDHVHLTSHGNYVLARAMFPKVVSMLPVEARQSAGTLEPLSEEQAGQLLAITNHDRRRLAQEITKRLARAPFTNQSTAADQLAAVQRDADAHPEDAERADAAYRWAVGKRPHDAFLRLNYARTLAVISDPDRAAEQLRRAVELQPNLLLARWALAELYSRTGRRDEAIVEYRELTTHAPYYADSYLGLVGALRAQNKIDEAIEAADRGEQVFRRYGLVEKAVAIRRMASDPGRGSGGRP
jgi:tetratricopeptide (TPR) repeat protein